MLCMILSWCKSRRVRSVQSIPEDLVADSIDAAGRAIDSQAERMDDLWDGVGKVATEGYRESAMERMVHVEVCKFLAEREVS